MPLPPLPLLSMRRVAECGSTQLEARAAAKAQEGGGVSVVADAQTAGRGRRGNVWVSPRGNLYASLCLIGAEAEPLLASPFLWGLAVLRTPFAVAAAVPLRLKWPNDVVLADGRKCGGILIERDGEQTGIGIGLNLRHAPDTDALPEDALPSACIPNSEAALPLMIWMQILHAAQALRACSLATMVAQVNAHLYGIGHPCTAELPDGRRIDGFCRGVGDDGALRIDTAHGVEHLYAAARLRYS